MSISTVTSVAMAAICLSCLAASPAVGGAKLRAEHPRLLFTTEDQKRIEELAKTDELLARLIEALCSGASRWEGAAPLKHRLIGPRLLTVSRECLARVSTCAMAYRLTGDKAHAKRAIENMLTVAAFKDWNPSHFLDVAEMTAALAIGYDWLYDTIDEADRRTIRGAIIEKGLKPGLRCYGGKGWWVKGTSNWNQVCNGGMTLGALAVAETDPDLSRQIVQHAVKSLPRAMGVYPPDGAYPEGPGYWKYGTSYNCVMLSALETVMGDAFGLTTLKDFDKTGLYRIHTIGPTGLYFNYPDCGTTATPSAAMFYLSRTYDRPMYAWWHREQLGKVVRSRRGSAGWRSMDRLAALEIAWYDERGEQPSAEDLPRDAFFRNEQDVVAMRSAWGDPDALYVGFKGGHNQANHAHMDIGSFVLSADGVRWAMDLGGDNYNLPGYWRQGRGGKRWNIYRLNNRSHNTLVIADALQDAHGKGKVALFQSTPQRVHAVVDMSSAYPKVARNVLRGVAVLDRRAVLIRDEVIHPAGPVRWGMVTGAECKLDGATATLTREGKTLVAEILSPAGATFEIVSTSPPTSKENPNTGTSMLATTVTPRRGATVAITILLRPVGERWNPAPKPTPVPIAKWKSLLAPK